MIEEFKQILNELGVNYRESHNSLATNHCPSCGSRKYKVFFAIDTEDRGLLGKCFRGVCQTGFNAEKYLIQIGMTKEEVRRRIGSVAFEDVLDVKNEIFSPVLVRISQEKEKPNFVENDISGFFDISVWPDHPAAKYAVARGVTEKAHRQIKIDADTNAVVFLCLDESGNCIGFQRRFLKPKYEWQKTKTSSGFKAHENVIVFPGGAKVCLCEGPFTAIAAQNYGFTGVCTFGSNIGNKQIEAALALSRGEEIYVGVDLDEAGEKYFEKIQKYCYWKNINAIRVLPESGADLNDSWVAGAGIKIEEKPLLNPSVPSFPEI